MSIVGFLRDRQADTLGFRSALVSWQNEQHPVSKNNVSPMKSGGREGTRTHDFLVANDGENKLRQGATIT